MWILNTWIQQIPQRRYRAVMQVRRAQPDAVERQVCVSEGFPEMAESPRVTGIKIVLRHGQFFGVGIEAVAVGAGFFGRDHVAVRFALEITSTGSLTGVTGMGVNFFAPGTA